mmetsp:Transcript_10251/g.35546  ORF Transcript_10251/g.35546 Transcript_10251/m.35546 type:complete len:699 (+) Transcript_10251:52-2148(+)
MRLQSRSGEAGCEAAAAALDGAAAVQTDEAPSDVDAAQTPADSDASKPRGRGLYWLTLAANAAAAVAAIALLRRLSAGAATWAAAVVCVSLVPRFARASYHVLRWPLLALVYAWLMVEFGAYVLLRLAVRFMEVVVATPRHRALRAALGQARDYGEWHKGAAALDASKGAALWQADLRSTRYNWPFIQGLISRLRESRLSGDWRSAAVALRLCSRPNVGGIMAPQLFSQTHTGEPKVIVTEFMAEVAATVEWLTARCGDAAMPEDERLACFHVAADLFAAAKESYGRTVLSLSGGGALGAYHFGVVRALCDADVLPTSVCGTSAGAIVAAFVCTRSADELRRDLYDDNALLAHLVCFNKTPLECLRHAWRHGTMYDQKEWLAICRWFANDQAGGVANMTFAEAFARSGRRLAITVCAKGKRAPPVLLTHLTSPNVVVASAIVATAGVPGLIAPTVLIEKDPETGRCAPQHGGEAYIDGSLVHDIPTGGLREAFNARFVVASQVNPHLNPLVYGTQGSAGDPSRWSSPRRAEDAWRGGFLLAALELYLRTDMLSKLGFLKEMDVTPGWTGTILTQDSKAEVTITPSLWLRDYFAVFKNPDAKSMPRFLRHGRVAAYQKIAMLRTRFVVERALGHAAAALRAHPRGDAASPRTGDDARYEAPRMSRVSQSTGALHWATPSAMNLYFQEGSDGALFEDDGL